MRSLMCTGMLIILAGMTLSCARGFSFPDSASPGLTLSRQWECGSLASGSACSKVVQAAQGGRLTEALSLARFEAEVVRDGSIEKQAKAFWNLAVLSEAHGDWLAAMRSLKTAAELYPQAQYTQELSFAVEQWRKVPRVPVFGPVMLWDGKSKLDCNSQMVVDSVRGTADIVARPGCSLTIRNSLLEGKIFASDNAFIHLVDTQVKGSLAVSGDLLMEGGSLSAPKSVPEKEFMLISVADHANLDLREVSMHGASHTENPQAAITVGKGSLHATGGTWENVETKLFLRSWAELDRTTIRTDAVVPAFEVQGASYLSLSNCVVEARRGIVIGQRDGYEPGRMVVVLEGGAITGTQFAIERNVQGNRTVVLRNKGCSVTGPSVH